MTTITCTRRLQFCAGHRVLGHEGKCARPHGHNYTLFVTAKAVKLDHLGRVIDFSVLKKVVGRWLEISWDHRFLVDSRDLMPRGFDCVPVPFNPTAENMANHLLTRVCPELLADTGVTVTKVVLWETDNCFAEASL